MMTINIEFLGETNMYFGLGIEMVTSVFLGALIGMDREKKLKAAGIKTNVLICMGASLYTAISIINMKLLGNGNVDPNRVAAQVVSGIGFLGAGAIIQSRGEVVGLTSAASIWVVAALGVTIGSGHPLVASIVAVTVFLVLRLLDPFYRFMNPGIYYELEIMSKGPVIKEIRHFMTYNEDHLYAVHENILNMDEDDRILYLTVRLAPKELKALLADIESLRHVKRINYRVLTSEQRKSLEDAAD